MKHLIVFSIIILSLSMASCSHRSGRTVRLTHEDSLKVASDRAFQARLAELQKVHQDLIGPSGAGDAAVTRGDMFRTNLMDDFTTEITGEFEKLSSKLELAQKDSTTYYGVLLTRFKLLKTQHKYLTATYTDAARLLRFTSEITFDDRHEEDRDFYFSNDTLVYFRERHTFTQGEQDIMTDDSYFIQNGKVVYSYRDEGSTQERKNQMDMIPLTRYFLKGDLTSHVSKEFENFKQDYDILSTKPLEPLIYPGKEVI